LKGLHPAIIAAASTHFIVDAYGNLFAPLLPLLIPRLDLSLKMVGTLAMIYQMANSVSQLAFGTLADRWRPRVLLMGGPLLSVIVLSAIGSATSTWMLAATLVIGGLGGAAFHPPAAALVNAVSDYRKGFAMSLHITGGSLGMSIAPLVFVPAIVALGLGWSWLVAVPGLFALAYTLTLMKNIRLPVSKGIQRWSDLRPYARPLGLLYIVVVLRTVTSQSLSTFLPVMLTQQGMGVGEASAAVTVYLFWSGIGGFFGGPLADRYGPRTVIIASLLMSVPFFVGAHWTAGWTFTTLVSIGAFLLQSTLPVNVTFGQQLAPVSAATVASLMMGFGWGSGALLAPVVGFLGDTMGLGFALLITAIIPVAAAAAALPLPNRAPASARPESEASHGGASPTRPEI
jgi:FSR family fosmidomycin resistance protein-like MFS transporter